MALTKKVFTSDAGKRVLASILEPIFTRAGLAQDSIDVLKVRAELTNDSKERLIYLQSAAMLAEKSVAAEWLTNFFVNDSIEI